jgi:hypothetical protein
LLLAVLRRVEVSHPIFNEINGAGAGLNLGLIFPTAWYKP